MDLDRIGLAPHEHACLIYHDPDEAFDIVAAMMRAARQANERYTHILHGTPRDAFFAAMRTRGIDAELALARGQLVLADSASTYLPDGRFDAARMLAYLRENDIASLGLGFRGSRASGEMEWWLTRAPGLDQAATYEAELNALLPQLCTRGVCLYDERAFPAALLPVVIRTHAKVIYRGHACENPFYVPPRDEQVDTGVKRQLRVLLNAARTSVALAAARSELDRAQREIDRLRARVSEPAHRRSLHAAGEHVRRARAHVVDRRQDEESDAAAAGAA